MTNVDPPAPAGTPYDGDPRFEALVFGWACSSAGWNGELPGSTPAGDRSQLAGYFEQFLEQQDDPAPVSRRDIVEAIGSVDAAVTSGMNPDRRSVLILRDFARDSLRGQQ